MIANRSMSPGGEAWRPGLALVTEAPSEATVPVGDPAFLDQLKERIRTVLMTRIDPSVAGRIPRSRLRGEVAQLVSEIATKDRVELNKTEEAALAADSATT